MTLSELPEIIKLLADTFRTAKSRYHNNDLVEENVIQIMNEKEVFFNEERNYYIGSWVCD